MIAVSHRTLATVLCMGAAACVQRPPAEGSDETTSHELAARESAAVGQPSVRITRDTLSALEAAARRIANVDGCTSAQQCRSAPIGAKACGGPRAYVVYCAPTTDTIALSRTLDDLRRLEQRYNEQERLVSDCMLVTAPEVMVAGNTCVRRER